VNLFISSDVPEIRLGTYSEISVHPGLYPGILEYSSTTLLEKRILQIGREISYDIWCRSISTLFKFM